MPSNTNPELQHEIEGILAAMRRAKRRAEDLVIATNTKLVESKDGKVVLLGAEEILARRRKSYASDRPDDDDGMVLPFEGDSTDFSEVEPILPKGDALTAAMVGIGMVFAATAALEPNIEDTLLAASIEGMEYDDLRVLSALTTWLSVHHQRVNADRLIRIVSMRGEQRVLAYWAAIAHWLNADRRLSRLAELAPEQRVHLLRVGSAFQLKRRGEDPRFEDSALVVPQGVLRDRDADVLTPQQLAARHRAYFQRIQIGPSCRADLWALLESEPTLSPTELARRGYGSLATAWQVKRDFETLHFRT